MSDLRKHRIIVVNRFFWPDHSATAQILSDLVFALSADGHEIDIIASRSSYSDSSISYPAREAISKVDIHRVATSNFGRANAIGSTIDYLSFYVAACWKALALTQRNDILVVKTDPPLLSVPMRLIARMRSAHQINWLQDIYPDVASRLGMKVFDGPLGSLLAKIRNSSLRNSAANVVLGERMEEVLGTMGIHEKRISIISNFTDEQMIRPLASTDNPLRREWGFEQKQFVVGYSGNLGRAHDLDTILEAARTISEIGRDDIRFLFVGGGALFDRIETRANEIGLKNVDLRPYQPRERLSQSLAVPDLHWISLRPSLEGYIVPSKFYGALAAGRPVIFIGDSDGEIAREIRHGKCGWTFNIGDSARLAEELIRLADDRFTLEKAGKNARDLLDRKFQREQSFDRWRELLSKIS